jgi:uncharacterized protein YcbX
MLVDATGTFVSQRSVPALTHFELTLGLQTLDIKFKEESITILLDDFQEEKKIVNVWESNFNTTVMNKLYNNFFSDILGNKYHLVSMRSSDIRKKQLKDGKDVEVSFADGYPYLMTGTASLADLNERLKIPIPMERFRANMVLNTTLAFEEEKIDTFYLGNALFKMVKPCKRCQVITIDQKTGISSAEPLKTLSKYRRCNGGVCFGMNAICLENGRITKGDKLIIRS